MSVIISPIITNAGLGVFTPSATGIEFTFTHVAVGTGTSAVTPAAISLESEIARFPIAGGGIVTGGQAVSINALITNHTNANPQNYDITEFGFYGLDALNNTILFAIYRTNTTIVRKVSGADISAPFVMGLAALPVNNMTVQIDTNASAMLALLGQHTASNHPHTQYKRTLDNTERLKAADAQDVDDVVTKAQLQAEAAIRAGVESALAALIVQLEGKSPTNQVAVIPAGTHYDLTLAPNEKIRVFMVGGGAEGGRQGTGDFEIVANDGDNSFISNQAQTIFYASAQGGKRGQGGWYEYQGGAAGANGIVAINSSHFEKMQALWASFDTKPASVPTDAGVGGAGAAAIANHNPGGKGGNGAFMDVIFTNTSGTNLDLRVYAAAVTPSGGYQSSGGQGGYCVLYREP